MQKKLVTAGNLLLLVTSAVSLCLANSAYGSAYEALLERQFCLIPLKEWVCEGLMSLFFLQVAIELKSEYQSGALAAKLPLFAALGGMVVPSIIFLLANFKNPSNYRAFAVPCATDIAFALFAFNLIAPSLRSARLLLLAIAIFDDLGAIALIALFYSSKVQALPLILAALGMILVALHKKVIKGGAFYVLAGGVLIWMGFKLSGIQPTLSGVVLGMLLPASKEPSRLLPAVVSLVVMPIFALTACNVDFSGFSFKALREPLFWGVAAGLLLGKPIGICSFALISVKSKLAALPTSWKELYIVSTIAGIGFTMSLFISELSFTDKWSLTLVKSGLVSASVISALWALLNSRLLLKHGRNKLSKSSQ